MFEIFKLVGNVFVDTDDADKSLANTDTKAQKLGTSFVNGATKVAKFGAMVGGVAIAGGAAVLSLANKTGDMADELLDLQSITGNSTDELQKWRRVATVAGVDTDAMAKVSQKLTKTLDTMSEGTGKAAEAAAELGFSYEDLMEMDADERLNAITEALGSVDDSTERAKLGTDLLGSSWSDLAPILDVGAESIASIKDNADIVSPEDLEQANEFRIKMDEMGEKATLFGQKLLIELMPMLNGLFDWIEDNMPEIEKFFDDAFTVIGDVVTVVIDVFNEYFLPVLVDLFDWVNEHMTEIQAVFEVVFDAVAAVVQVGIDMFTTFLLPILEKVVDYVSENFDTIAIVVEEVFTAILIPIQAAMDLLMAFLDLIPQGGELKTEDLIADAKGTGATDEEINAVMDSDAPNFMKKKQIIDLVKEASHSSGSFGTTQGLARGGEALTSGVIRVGERGIEDLYVPQGARVKPTSDKDNGINVTISLDGATYINDQAMEDMSDALARYLRSQGVLV